MADQRLTNFLVLFGTFFFGDVYIIDKLTAVPTARVARKARSPTFGTGLQLVGGSAPKPLAYPLHNIYFSLKNKSVCRDLSETLEFRAK